MPTIYKHRPFIKRRRRPVFSAALADVVIDAGASANTARVMRGLVQVSSLVSYKFFIDADTNYKYEKSTDGGQTWGSPVTIRTALDQVRAADVWFDRWTPGDSGTLIHTCCVDFTAGGDALYRTLDTADDSLGTERVAANGTTGVGQNLPPWVSLAKMRGGNIYVAWCFGLTSGLARTVDGGANWTSRTNPMESVDDQGWLFPGNEADNQDLRIAYLDTSANELTLKLHDDSANTNSESSAIATVAETMTDGTYQWPFAGALRHSDGHVIGVVSTELDSGTADLRAFDIDTIGSITELTAIATNVDDIYYPAVFVAENDDIYVAHIGKSDGSETLGTTAGVYYRKSTDDGTTWGAETAYSVGISDWRQTWVSPNGQRFAVAWRDASDNRILTNYTNSVLIETLVALPAFVASCGLASPTITAGASLALQPLLASGIIAAPTVSHDGNVAVPALIVAAGLAAPTVAAGASVPLSPLIADGAIAAPAISAGATVPLQPLIADALLVALSSSAAVSVDLPAFIVDCRLVAPQVTAGATVPMPALMVDALLGGGLVFDTATIIELPAFVVSCGLAAPTISAGATAELQPLKADAGLAAPNLVGGAVVGLPTLMADALLSHIAPTAGADVPVPALIVDTWLVAPELSSVIAGPYYIDAAEIFVPGAEASQIFVPGSEESQIGGA